MKAADLVFTGEGRLDFQSVMGKAPLGIARLGKRYGKPVIAIAGSITDDAAKAHDQGVTAMFSITDGPMSLAQAMDSTNAHHLVTKTVKQIMHLISLPVLIHQSFSWNGNGLLPEGLQLDFRNSEK